MQILCADWFTFRAKCAIMDKKGGGSVKAWQHFKTVNWHRFLVMKLCFRVGLYRQGLCHDLSKYSPTEFLVGARYYAGTRSPNAVEREKIGYSSAWMHHKGRNRHHYEYWSDLDPVTKRYAPVEMPRRYLAEMVIDRIAACMTYHGKDYRDGDALAYYLRSAETKLMHPETSRQLRLLLELLAEKGEDALFRFLRETVIPGKPF